MADEAKLRFETLQLHAGYVLLSCFFFFWVMGLGEGGFFFFFKKLEELMDGWDSRQEPDPASKARAVPIYATTVGRGFALMLFEFAG